MAKRIGVAVASALVALIADGVRQTPFAQDKPMATINGKTVTDADLKLAETEIGAELQQVPEGSRRRILLEYLIENQIFADAAEGATSGTRPVKY